MRPSEKKLLCLDFDGVLHSYTSGWKGADVIPDPMVAGTAEFIMRASQFFKIAIFSARSSDPKGVDAMRIWLAYNMFKAVPNDREAVRKVLADIMWPTTKPPAHLTIDDRALRFTGDWADFPLEALSDFKPWNKTKEPAE